MDPDILKFFAAMMTLTFCGGLFMLITSLARRIGNPPRAPSSDEIEDLRARLDALEQRASQYEELDERLDFLERMALALREGKPAPQGLPPRKERTPV
ncbi:MAG TPA: hypothetical protein VNL98_02450 [Gemmatimonadales bacterium]|nr:hypothetical protein [Gemmatimonadales bacterium]